MSAAETLKELSAQCRRAAGRDTWPVNDLVSETLSLVMLVIVYLSEKEHEDLLNDRELLTAVLALTKRVEALENA